MELDATMPATSETFADFDDCFRTLYPRVARTAALVARDPELGADLAQEAFARLYERWDRMGSADHVRNFAFRVAINLARSHLRRRAAAPFGLRGPERSITDPNEPTAGWLDAVEALDSLSPRQRACVVLAELRGPRRGDDRTRARDASEHRPRPPAPRSPRASRAARSARWPR